MLLLTDFVLVSGFSITLLLLIILIKSKYKQLPQKILIVLLSFVAITITSFYADLHNLKSIHLITSLFESGERFILGPLVYIYVKSLFLKEKDLVKRHLWHFIPFVVYWVAFTIPFSISTQKGYLIFEYLTPFVNTPYAALIKDFFLLVYISLSIRLFYKFKRILKYNYSNFTTTNIIWLKKFLFFLFSLILFDFLITFYELLFGYFTSWDTGYITAVLMIISVAYLGYHGIKQSTIAIPDFVLDGGFVDRYNSAKVLSELSDEELKLLKAKLEAVIKKEKPYLSTDLTLSNLAEMVGTSNRKLSIVLNRCLQISFYDFINSHRIEAVKEKIQSDDYKNYSIVGIAYDAGFKSKSSFYRIFKKETGFSPTEYKKKSSEEIVLLNSTGLTS